MYFKEYDPEIIAGLFLEFENLKSNMAYLADEVIKSKNRIKTKIKNKEKITEEDLVYFQYIGHIMSELGKETSVSKRYCLQPELYVG